MKFRFPLEKVMNHRKVLEELAQKDFEEAQSRLFAEQKKLQQMQEAVDNARADAFRRQSEGGKTGPALVQADEFIKGQDIRMERQKLHIQEAESLVENLREILRQKAIDYKIIEELRDRRLQEFKVEQRKREQKLVDDLNIMRFRREDAEKK